MDSQKFELIKFQRRYFLDEICQICPYIPFEIIYHHIIPYVPFMNLTRNILKLQKTRIIVNSLIKKQLLIECPHLKNYIFTTYRGEKKIFFEQNNAANNTVRYYLYVVFDSRKRRITDFFSIFY